MPPRKKVSVPRYVHGVLSAFRPYRETTLSSRSPLFWRGFDPLPESYRSSNPRVERQQRLRIQNWLFAFSRAFTFNRMAIIQGSFPPRESVPERLALVVLKKYGWSPHPNGLADRERQLDNKGALDRVVSELRQVSRVNARAINSLVGRRKTPPRMG